jgi:hypothetical protein
MLFFAEPKDDVVSVVIPSFFTRSAITVCFVMTVVLGVYPSLVLNMTETFGTFLR